MAYYFLSSLPSLTTYGGTTTSVDPGQIGRSSSVCSLNTLQQSSMIVVEEEEVLLLGSLDIRSEFSAIIKFDCAILLPQSQRKIEPFSTYSITNNYLYQYECLVSAVQLVVFSDIMIMNLLLCEKDTRGCN